MTEILCSPKIKPEHLARKAIVYLRQSSDKQVRQNLESQRLQYEVAERIRSLGWRHVEIIDSDLGSSAGMASARSRTCAQFGGSWRSWHRWQPRCLASLPHRQGLVPVVGSLPDFRDAHCGRTTDL